MRLLLANLVKIQSVAKLETLLSLLRLCCLQGMHSNLVLILNCMLMCSYFDSFSNCSGRCKLRYMTCPNLHHPHSKHHKYSVVGILFHDWKDKWIFGNLISINVIDMFVFRTLNLPFICIMVKQMPNKVVILRYDFVKVFTLWCWRATVNSNGR